MEKTKEIDYKKYAKWVTVIVLLAIFIILWITVENGSIHEFDDKIYKAINGIKSTTLTNILIVITELGGVIGLFFILLITVSILWYKNRKKEALGITLNLMLSTFVYIILKQIFQRTRPITGDILVDEIGFSFPSGHSTNNMAFYSFAIYLVCLNVKNHNLRNILCVILGIIPILVGFSRVYLRVHYPSDVIAGFCLGIILVILFITFIYPQIKDNKK